MSSESQPTLPSQPDQLAKLAFGSMPAGATHHTAVGRHLALLPLDALELDLSDPEQCHFGDYELMEKIGQGGMGVVYRARQHSLDREVALKLLAAGPWASDDFVARFKREAQSAARMQHPNIVEIYEIGQIDALNFFAMRLVRGHTLAQALSKPEPFDPQRAARLLRTVAEAVDYAHRLGVLHLDLKPGNVLIDERGEPLVADFGLARRMDESFSTDGDEVSGTPSYMAPEQAQLKSHKLRPATDIYGLGAILYEALTGVPPFLAATPQATLQRVVSEPVSRPRSYRKRIPADLEAICLKCLEKDPRERYASARELADDLGNFLANRPVSVRAPDLWERTRRWWEHHKAEVAMLALLLAGFVGTTKEWLRADKALAESQQQQAIAQQQSARSAQLTGLIAQAFPVPKDKETQTALESAAERIVIWLDGSLTDRPELRQDLLLGLVDALDRADNPGAAQSLLAPVVTKLGSEFRLRAAEAQISKATPRGKLLGAMLLQSDGMDEKSKQRQSNLLVEAIQAAPDDEDVLAAATYYLTSDTAGAPNPALRLTQLRPENAANWLFAMRKGDNEALTRSYLEHAATAASIDDHFNLVMRLHREAVETAGVPAPPLLAAISGKLAPEADSIEVVAYYMTWVLPIPTWQAFMQACRPDQAAAREPARRENCLQAGRKAAFEGHSLLATMIGSTVVRNLDPGADEQALARELRRQYVYTMDMLASRTPAQIRASNEALIGRELGQLKEIEAYKRVLDRAGIPRDPPADWEPKNPEQLMTGLERETYYKRRAALAREKLLPDPTPAPAQ